LLYSKGEEALDEERTKKMKMTAAKSMPRRIGQCVITGHDDDFDIWSIMNQVDTVGPPPPSQIIEFQPGAVLAVATEAKAKEGQANHAADGSDVSGDASDAAAHGSSKPSSEACDYLAWWESEADSEAEDAWWWTREEKEQEADVISKRLATFGKDFPSRSQLDEEFWKREVGRLVKRREMLKQQIEAMKVKETEETKSKPSQEEIEEEELKRQIELEGDAIG